MLEDSYSINYKNKLIVIAMTRWHKNDEIWMSKLIKFCNKNNFEIVIKIHPLYKTTMTEMSKNKIELISNACQNFKYLITYDVDLSILNSVADLVITDHSDAGIEACLLEKPLITTNFIKEDWSNVPRYHEYGASIFTDDYLELEKIILEILIDGKHLEILKEGRKNIVNAYNYFNDVKAAERIFELLLTQNFQN